MRELVSKVHIVHVGNMANKGTQALLKSDVALIRDIVGADTSLSASTTDIEGVKALRIGLDAVLPAAVDIPYERADAYAKRARLSRKDFRYKLFALAVLFSTPIQVTLSLISVALIRIGSKPFYRPALFSRIKESDLVVSYSDENFKETASMLPLNIYWILSWWSMLFSRAWDTIVARLLGKRIVMFPNSVGPFHTSVGRLISRIALLNCAYVLVREKVSFDIVKSLDERLNPILTSDTVITFGLDSRETDVRRRSRSISVSPGVYSGSIPEKQLDSYVAAHAKALDDAIVSFGCSVVFLPHYVTGFKQDDLEISKRIVSMMTNSNKARIIKARTVEEFRELIGQTELLVSSKMHPMVIAASVFVPSVCVVYDHKQTGFLKGLGMSGCAISLNEITHRRLFSRIDYAWNARGSLTESLKLKVPEMQKDVRTNVSRALSGLI